MRTGPATGPGTARGPGGAPAAAGPAEVCAMAGTTTGQGPRRRPTIRDVAREAGVSYATVSRVLNGGRWVGAEAQLAVRAAIERTGYTANRHARSLATGRSGSVVFLVTEPHETLFEDPNLSVLLRGVAKEISAGPLTLVLMIANTEVERERVLGFIDGGHADGVLLVSSHAGDPLLDDLARTGLPTVACGRVIGHEDTISSVAADDLAGARTVVEHLLRSGRRTVATVAGRQDTGGGVDRLLGYRQALAQAGLPVDEDLVVTGDWSHESGRAATHELLRRRPDVDAVFAANDIMAAGALAALRALGRRVPDDVHVAGFDDIGLAATLDPPLTSARQPFDRISREMVRLIQEATAGTGPGTDDDAPAGAPGGRALAVTVPTTLVVRASAPGPTAV